MVEFEWPEYHANGMGCGLEDRGITDRYEAMRYGWDCAMDRCAEVVPDEPLMTVAQHDRILRQATYLLVSAHIADMNAKATELELLRSALNHIIKTCNQSRTETRRLRWIAQRAQWALEGKKYDISAFDLPKYSATAKERLEREVKILREQVAQTGQVPQAWLDVQAERRRQIEEDGWIPELNEQHKAGELARAAAAYLLYAYPRVPFDVTLAARLWPWVSGFNPKGVRQVLVRACSLVLGELDGLDHTAELAEGSPVDESPVINNSLGSHSGTKHRQSEVEQPTQELTTLRSTVAIAPELLQRVVDHLEWEGKPETTAYGYVSRGDRLAEELRTEIGDAPETVEHDIQG